MVSVEDAPPLISNNGEVANAYVPHYSWVINPSVGVIFVISIIGSVSIFFLVCLSKTFRRTSNYLIANLCVASIYHMIVSVLYNLQSGGIELWSYGPLTCHILGLVHRLSLPVLPLTIAGISLDRSVVARNPLDYPSKKTAILKVVFIWIFSFVLLLPRAYMNVYDEGLKGTYKCSKVLLWDNVFLQSMYALLILVVIYFIPCYILVKETFAMRCQMRFLTMSRVEQRKTFHRRVRVMKNACIFTCIFILCWLPQGIIQFPFDLPDGYFFTRESINILSSLRNLAGQLTLFNACLNPIILLSLSFDMREYLTNYCYV